MRLSPQRHTLAVLRTILGLTQKQMAEILECSVPTVQAIELGKLKLSLRLANNLFNHTVVNLNWLMSDDVTQPPTDFQDRPYTQKIFQERQAQLFNPPEDSSDVRRSLFYARASFRRAVEKLATLFTHAYREDRVQMCAYKISDALQALLQENIDPTKLTPEEKERAQTLRLHASKPEDLLAVVRRFVKETDDIFQQRIAAFEPPPPGGHHPTHASDLPPPLSKVRPRKATRAARK